MPEEQGGEPVTESLVLSRRDAATSKIATARHRPPRRDGGVRTSHPGPAAIADREQGCGECVHGVHPDSQREYVQVRPEPGQHRLHEVTCTQDAGHATAGAVDGTASGGVQNPVGNDEQRRAPHRADEFNRAVPRAHHASARYFSASVVSVMPCPDRVVVTGR